MRIVAYLITNIIAMTILCRACGFETTVLTELALICAYVCEINYKKG